MRTPPIPRTVLGQSVGQSYSALTQEDEARRAGEGPVSTTSIDNALGQRARQIQGDRRRLHVQRRRHQHTL